MFDDKMLKFIGFILTMALVGGGVYMMIILLNALSRKLTGGRGESPTELEELQDRLAELEGQVADLSSHASGEYLADLEERLEFAERLLANEGNRAALPEPSDEVTGRGARAGG